MDKYDEYKIYSVLDEEFLAEELKELGMELDDFLWLDDDEKMTFIEENELDIYDYAGMFDDFCKYEELYFEEESIKTLWKLGIDLEEFFFMDDYEKKELLTKYDLDIKEYRDYFDDYEENIKNPIIQTFEGYDYYQAFSYFQKDNSYADWIEGNDELDVPVVYNIYGVKQKEEKHKKILVKGFESIIYIIKNKYPDMFSIVEAITYNFKKKNDGINTYVMKARQGEKEALDYVGMYYIKNILKMSINEADKYNDNFYEIYDRNIMWLNEAIWKADLSIRNSIMAYVYYKRKYYRLFQQEKDYLFAFPAGVNRILTRWNGLNEAYKEEVYNLMCEGLKEYNNPLIYLSDYDKRICLGAICPDEGTIRKVVMILGWEFVSFDDLYNNPTLAMINEAKYFSDNDITVDTVLTNDLKTRIKELLFDLRIREREIIILRFGLGDECPRTLEEVGREYNLTRERIRQIEAKALRKLRNPCRSKKLRNYLYEY